MTQSGLQAFIETPVINRKGATVEMKQTNNKCVDF